MVRLRSILLTAWLCSLMRNSEGAGDLSPPKPNMDKLRPGEIATSAAVAIDLNDLSDSAAKPELKPAQELGTDDFSAPPPAGFPLRTPLRAKRGQHSDLPFGESAEEEQPLGVPSSFISEAKADAAIALELGEVGEAEADPTGATELWAAATVSDAVPETAPKAGAANLTPEEAVAAALCEARTLRAEAASAIEEESWTGAATLYEEACEVLAVCGEDAHGTDLAKKELQSCRLQLSLCQLKLDRLDAAVVTCSAVIRANPRCAAGWYRRAQALGDSGELDAAAFDLERAIALKPKNQALRDELERVERRRKERRPSLGGGLAEALGGSLGSGGAADGGLAALFGEGAKGGGLAGLFGDAGGKLAGDPVDGMQGLLGGFFGGPGGAAAKKSGGGGEQGLEALLNSPLLDSLTGGSDGGAIGMLRSALAARRRWKRYYAAIKPWLPLIFLLVLAMPWIHTVALPWLIEHLFGGAR